MVLLFKKLTMRFENSVVELKRQLLLLGFTAGLEAELRAKICFQPERFTLRYRLVKDADVVEFVLQFELGNNGYACSFYEAVLRKRILVDHELDVEMQTVNWNSIVGVESEDKVDTIITQLNQLETTEEGKGIAAILKLKYWSGTIVEDLIPNLSALKSRYEISQRFYFFDGEGQITVEEAYRFLCNRWLEKQMQLRKKQEVFVPPADTGGQASSSSDNAMMRKISLLPKKKRGQGRGIK